MRGPSRPREAGCGQGPTVSCCSGSVGDEQPGDAKLLEVQEGVNSAGKGLERLRDRRAAQACKQPTAPRPVVRPLQLAYFMSLARCGKEDDNASVRGQLP